MKYEAINWEGALIGPETIEKVADENALKGQKSGDFGLSGKVRDEILSSWAEAKALWALFQTRRAREDQKDQFGTSRTRQSWMIPFLALLGYELENANVETVAGKNFAISHRDAKRLAPVHIVGFAESLDKKRVQDKLAASAGHHHPVPQQNCRRVIQAADHKGGQLPVDHCHQVDHKSFICPAMPVLPQ